VARGLVGSIHPLVQNVILLNSVSPLPVLESPPFLSFLNGHVFLLHPFVLCKTATHYTFNCIAHSKHNYP